MAKYVINEQSDLAAVAREVEEIANRKQAAQAEPNTLEPDSASLTASPSPRARAAESVPAKMHPLVLAGLGTAAMAAMVLLVVVLAQAVSRSRAVPDLVGQQVDVAESLLKRAGLASRTEYVSSKEKPGTVIALLPAQGTKVRTGAVITVKVSSAQIKRRSSTTSDKSQMTTVPDPAPTPPKPDGGESTPKVVITPSPEAKKTPAVTPATPQKVAIPPVEGLPIAEARLALESAGLRIEATDVQDSSKPDGLVLALDPKAGTLVPPGAPVRVKVNDNPAPPAHATHTAPPQEPPMVIVPDYTGIPGKDAASDAYARNLKPEWQYQESPRWSGGTVILTAPPAGSRVPPGSKIMLMLAK